MADIGAPILRLSASGAKLSDQSLPAFVASAGDSDTRTLFREGQGGSSSNAREGASDQNNRGIHSELL
jgi:hypothetical protein